MNPRLVARRARIGDDYVREALAPTRFTLALLGAFAAVALLLAIVGLYGSISYSVSQRTREIGIRIALGAPLQSVTGHIVGEGVRLTLAGLAIGAGAGVTASGTLSSLLYAVRPSDPATFVAIASLSRSSHSVPRTSRRAAPRASTRSTRSGLTDVEATCRIHQFSTRRVSPNPEVRPSALACWRACEAFWSPGAAEESDPRRHGAEYVIGYLCRELEAKRIITAAALQRSS